MIDQDRLGEHEDILCELMEKAIEANNRDTVKLLLNEGVDPSLRCYKDNQASFIAKVMHYGDLENAQALYQYR